MNISEVLGVIDNNFIIRDVRDKSEKKYHAKEYLRTAISEMLDGVVPERRLTDDWTYNLGLRDCRSEVERRVEALKK